ncbi:MAG: histidine kinase [Bacteroidota bacterium]
MDADIPTIRWSKDHGLKHHSVHDLAVDSRGIIWVGTEDGIYRHHGHEFENINTIINNSPFENPINIVDLFIDDKDRLWIGTYENGLMMFDLSSNELQHYRALLNGKDHLSNLRIYSLQTMNDSIIRFTSHTHGLIDYNINKNDFNVKEVFTDSTELARLDGFQLMLQPLDAANSERVPNWYLSLTGMVEYDVTLDTFFYYQEEDDHQRLRDGVMDADSVVWCVTYGQGLYSFDLATKEFTNYRCFDGRNWGHGCLTGGAIELYNDSTLILDTRDGIYFFNKRNKTFERYMDSSPHGLWPGRTSQMEWIDDELWLASWTSSLYRFDKDDYGVRSVSAAAYVNAVYYDSYNERYMSISHPDLITIHKGDSFEEIRVPNEYRKDYNIEEVVIDREGKFWIATNNEILLFDEKNQTYSMPFENVLKKIRADLTFQKLGENPNGTIWASSHDGTIFTFDPITLQYKMFGGKAKESIPITFNYRAYLEGFTDDGYTWFSAQEGFFGLSSNNDAHKFSKDLKDSKTKQPITSISSAIGLGFNNEICFGSKTHLLYLINRDSLNGGYAHSIDIKDIVPDIDIYDIEIDKNGYVWISTKLGIIRYELATKEATLFDDAVRLNNAYDIEIVNDIPIALIGNNFRIINPNKLKKNSGQPNIHILSAELDAKEIFGSDSLNIRNGQIIELRPNDNYMRIRFNDFNYASQQPKNYAIKIEGLHDDWIDLGDRNEFGFSGLRGGLSKVFVKSKPQFAKNYSEPVELLSLDVTPPLTQRPSFWLLSAGLVMLLFYFGYRYRLSQLKEKQNLMIAFNKQLAETEMKALRAQMNPHFLFNVLNAIKLNVQKDERENAIDFITDFSKLIRSVLQNSGRKRVSLEEELQTLELYIKIERKRFATSFDYELEIDESIDASQFTIPPMLLQPYVENAIWHGILHKSEEKGKIKIHVYPDEKSIVVEITDNGIGREKANQLKLKSAQKNKSMGMQITRDRMAMSNLVSSDHIELQIVDLYANSKPAGTKVLVTIHKNH